MSTFTNTLFSCITHNRLMSKSTTNWIGPQWDMNEFVHNYIIIIGCEVIEVTCKCCGHFIIIWKLNILYYFVPLWETVWNKMHYYSLMSALDGSCVLKGSMVECWAIPSIDMLDGHSIGGQSANFWLMHISWLTFLQLSTNFW